MTREEAVAEAKHRQASDPDASWKFRWAGLRHQGRQQQLQTRLKSTCRRATNQTLRWRLRAAVTWPLCHDWRPRRFTGSDLCSG